jgi:hypothetical protein
MAIGGERNARDCGIDCVKKNRDSIFQSIAQ